MLGIYFDYRKNGPGKLIDNLIKGLDKIDIDYHLNSDSKYNLILQNVSRLHNNIENCIIGPNVCTLPIDNSIIMNYDSYNKLIVPSEWVFNLYKKWIPEDKIRIWSIGIDIEIFNDVCTLKEVDFLIYFKRRNRDDLNKIISFLNEIKKSYMVIEYGNYSESDFKDKISKSRYGIVVDNCESQGIAIMEMLACNLPLLVWDVNTWNDRGDSNKCVATSIPYWDHRCGEYFIDFNDFETKYNIFIKKSYNPRNYIIENHTIDKSIEKLLYIINE